MTLEPLLAASPVIQVHVATVSVAFVLGLAQFAAPKGVTLHRIMGWSWVGVMVVAAVSSFWIKSWGQWSAIHFLSVLVLIMLPVGVAFARRGRLRGHKITMISIFVGALVIAGLFTFIPGRLMHATIF